VIVPLVEENVWTEFLSDIASWIPDERPMLIVAPHPDDETLAAGGLIATQKSRGVEVRVVAVTDGEMAYADTPGLARIRQMEQEKALAILGVRSTDVIRLRLPDSSVGSFEESLVEALACLVTAETLIVAPWRGDFHPDHEACGRAAEHASKLTGAKLISYFFWTWHRGTPRLLDGLPLASMPLGENLLRTKCRALREHQSQFHWQDGDPILGESLLAPARRSFEVFLAE
jgi:LmbE family N-acetylglucosaminyl deacetylase